MGAKFLSKIVLIVCVLNCSSGSEIEPRQCIELVKTDIRSAVEGARIAEVNYPGVSCFCKWSAGADALTTPNDSALRPNADYQRRLSTLAVRELAAYQGFEDILLDRLEQEGFYTIRGIKNLCRNLRD